MNKVLNDFPNAHRVSPFVILDMVDRKIKNFLSINDYYLFFNEIWKLLTQTPWAKLYVYPQPINDAGTQVDIPALLFYERLIAYMKMPTLKNSKFASQVQLIDREIIWKEWFDITLSSWVKMGFLELPGFTNRSKHPQRFIPSLRNKVNTAFQNTMQHCWDTLQVAEAQKDLLTGLYSRRYGIWMIIKNIANKLKNQESMGWFIFIDIDNFKKINDTFGHESWDKAIKMVSYILQKSISDDDLAVRFWWEELIIYCPSKSFNEIEILACAINTAISRFDFKSSVWQERITVSVGFSMVENHNDSSEADPEKIMDDGIWKADLAMYYVKENGKNAVIAYSEELKKYAQSKNARSKR